MTVAAGYNSLVDPLTHEAISSPSQPSRSHALNPVPSTLRLTIRPRAWRSGTHNPFEEFCGLYHALPVNSRRVSSINFAKGTLRWMESNDVYADCDLNDERLYPSGTHLRGARERADSLADLASATRTDEVNSGVVGAGRHADGENHGSSDVPDLTNQHGGSARAGCGRPQRFDSAAVSSSSRPTVGESRSFSNCTTGLGNLSNTCFMNSMLQSLNAVPALVSFFLDQSNVEASLNLRNVLGSGGRVAKAFAALIQSMHRAASPSAILYDFVPVVFAPRMLPNSWQAVHPCVCFVQQVPRPIS